MFLLFIVFRSARSLTTTHTPTRRSLIAPWRDSSTVDVEDPIEEPLLGGSLPTRPMQPSKPKNLLCIVSFKPAFLFFVWNYLWLWFSWDVCQLIFFSSGACYNFHRRNPEFHPYKKHKAEYGCWNTKPKAPSGRISYVTEIHNFFFGMDVHW